MPTLAKLPPGFDLMSLVVGVYDHFTHYVTLHGGATVASDSGTVAVGDGANGILVITPSDGTVGDNDESYYKGANEVFLMAANRTINFACLAQYSEANTDDANIILGLLNAVAANHLQDDGAGPVASFSGFCFYKVDGGTVWNVRSSLGTTKTTTATNITAGGSAYHLFEIEFRALTSTVGEVVFLYDGQVCRDANNLPIKHSITYTSATEMQICLGVKNGNTNLETLNIDAVAAWQTR